MNQALKINGSNNWNMKSSKVQNVFVQQEVKRIINFVIKIVGQMYIVCINITQHWQNKLSNNKSK